MSTVGAFGNAEARKARSLAILAKQAADAERYRAENPSPYVADADRTASALAAQRARDDIDAARSSLQPDFATSCRIAANRRTNAAQFAKERVVTLPAMVEPALSSDVGPEELTAQAKRCRKRMERSEREIIALQTFVGPRTIAGAQMAEALRQYHDKNYKTCLGWLKDAQPILAHNRTDKRSGELAEAIKSFLEESEADTGNSMSVEEYAKQVNKKAKLREMAAEICRRLKLEGVETRRQDDCGLWVYWIHSGVWEEIDQYRRICINPLVAASSRAPILASLEYFIQEHHFCRFWTFTTGPRCLVADIPDRLATYFRKLSKLNYWMRKNYGVEIVLASTEFGTLETEAADAEEGGKIEFGRLFNEKTGLHSDEPLYHPHFHCVVRVIGKRPLNNDLWTELCEKVRARWGCKCDFDGIIRNAREIVKYVTKPGDLLKLAPTQLKAFYEATANRRLVRPMGALRREIAARKEAGETLRRIKTGGGKAWKWVVRMDHNKTLRDSISPEERAAMDELIDAEVFAAECAASARCTPGVVEVGETFTMWDDGTSHREGAGSVIAEGLPVRLKDKPNFCQVVAFIPPAAGPTMRKENRVIVMGNRRDVAAVNRHPLVKQLRERTWTSWAAGEALAGDEACFSDLASISVHTGTVTVPDELQTPGGWRLDDPIQLVFETA